MRATDVVSDSCVGRVESSPCRLRTEDRRLKTRSVAIYTHTHTYRRRPIGGRSAHRVTVVAQRTFRTAVTPGWCRTFVHTRLREELRTASVQLLASLSEADCRR